MPEEQVHMQQSFNRGFDFMVDVFKWLAELGAMIIGALLPLLIGIVVMLIFVFMLFVIASIPIALHEKFRKKGDGDGA